jgi:TctA family transporter
LFQKAQFHPLDHVYSHPCDHEKKSQSLISNLKDAVMMFGGMLWGLIFGMIPGLAGTLALALALPLILGMDPLAGSYFLIAIIDPFFDILVSF